MNKSIDKYWKLIKWLSGLIFSLLIVIDGPELYAQVNTDAIYTNINTINNRIYRIRSQINSLREKINEHGEQLVRQKGINYDLKTDIDSNIAELKKLEEEFRLIRIDYKAVLKELANIGIHLEKQDTTLAVHSDLIHNLNYKLVDLKIKFNALSDKFNGIPKVLYCKECYPVLSLEISNAYFPTYGKDNIDAASSFLYEFRYNYNPAYSMWFNFTSPTITALNSEPNISDGIFRDEWEITLVSAGFIYNFGSHEHDLFGFSAGGGLYYGAITYNKVTSDYLEGRMPPDDLSSFGLALRAELNYNEIIYKNMFSIFISLNSYISPENIILESGVKKDSDLGKGFLSLAFGLRFNFWGKE